jgi:hypothetical protein
MSVANHTVTVKITEISLLSAMHSWCDRHCSGVYSDDNNGFYLFEDEYQYGYYTVTFSFDNDTDAMLFKLTFSQYL